MIIYDLLCASGHEFEGWFASGAEFARQKVAHLVSCPVCDGRDIERRPSAKVRVTKTAVAAAPMAPVAHDAIAGIPSELLAKLREAVRKTEDVGERFPEEARKIHYDEVPARSIRGKASPEEAEALSEEGIDFSQLPPILTRDSH
ncbi:MAG: DUF1178 family protein [Betaproteobacteria bacterium]